LRPEQYNPYELKEKAWKKTLQRKQARPTNKQAIQQNKQNQIQKQPKDAQISKLVPKTTANRQVGKLGGLFNLQIKARPTEQIVCFSVFIYLIYFVFFNIYYLIYFLLILL
jgi:hypothetical protein